MTPILPSDVDASAPSRVSEKAADLAEQLETIAGMAPEATGVTSLIPKSRDILKETAEALRALQPHPNAGQAVAVADWSAVAKLAGEYGIRFPSNWRLEKFLTEIRPHISSPIPAAPVRSGVKPWPAACRVPVNDETVLLIHEWAEADELAERLNVTPIPLYTSSQPVEPAPGAGEDAEREARNDLRDQIAKFAISNALLMAAIKPFLPFAEEVERTHRPLMDGDKEVTATFTVDQMRYLNHQIREFKERHRAKR